MPTTLSGQRIVVIGVTGSGKTTCARRIARSRGIPHVELDALYWDANWTPASVELFRQRVSAALQAPAWVVDGNYSAVRDLVWSRADTIIWLDYPLILILWRLLRRSISRAYSQEELWQGNRESWRSQFFSRDSLFLWALKTYRRRRREYSQLLGDPANAHLRSFRLRSPRATEAWLPQHFSS